MSSASSIRYILMVSFGMSSNLICWYPFSNRVTRSRSSRILSLGGNSIHIWPRTRLLSRKIRCARLRTRACSSSKSGGGIFDSPLVDDRSDPGDDVVHRAAPLLDDRVVRRSHHDRDSPPDRLVRRVAHLAEVV